MDAPKKQGFSVTQSGQVVNAAGVVVKNSPMAGGRKWIKLWVDPWLDGTTRYMLSGSERAFWVDLLAEAGRSRFAGYVCPGVEHGELIGYPLPWYQSKQPDLDILATFEKFAAQNKIAYEITSQNPTSVVVQILNWDRYQSPLDDATRARMSRHRKKKQSLSGSSRQSITEQDRSVTAERHPPTVPEEEEEKKRTEQDKDKEEEEDTLRATAAAADERIRDAFKIFQNHCEPFGGLQFQLEWLSCVESANQHDLRHASYRYQYLAGTIERCIQACLRKRITVPRPLYTEKRLAESIT